MDKVNNIVVTLARLANASEDQAKQLITAYADMNDIEIIKDLSMIAYRTFSNNEGFYTYALTLIRSINPNKCPSVNEMKTILDNMFSNKVEGNMELEEVQKKKLVQTIQEDSQWLARMVENLLSVTKIQDGITTLKKKDNNYLDIMMI